MSQQPDHLCTVCGGECGGVTTGTAKSCAGIGGTLAKNGGIITINGGNVTVKGADLAAGIGGGESGSGGTITINGGNVTARGGTMAGAGIGGGIGCSGGVIVITGGKVIARGGFYAAGIGGGGGIIGNPTAGNISITGGDITATGSLGGADIGGGCKDPNKEIASGGTVTVLGANLQNSSGKAPNINAGDTGIVVIISVQADPAAIDFGKDEEGYALAAQTVTITNTGNQEMKLQQPTARNFTIGALSANVLKATNDTATFTVAPKAGLAAGSYQEIITVRATAGQHSVAMALPVNFQVERGVIVPQPTVSADDAVVPQTGDSSTPALWLYLLLLSAAGIAACGKARKTH